MPKLRTTCGECGKAYTAEEMAKRIEAQKQNALISRAKAKASGKKLGRKPSVNPMSVRELWLQGQRVSRIAKELGVSIHSVYRALRAAERGEK